MQPVSPYRTRYENANDEGESSPVPGGAGGGPKPPPDPADLPDLRDHTQDSGPMAPLVPMRPVDPSSPDVRDAAMKKGLDQFRESMTPEFRTPEGPAKVPITFQMTFDYPHQASLADAPESPEMKAAAASAHLDREAVSRVLSGRGSPGEVRALTQALIDRVGVPPGPGKLIDRVRQVMFEHHIGVDCAGYTQQAYLAATGLSRTQAGFTADPLMENLPLDKRPAYRRVAPENVRPGDVGVLGPPPREWVGHRVVVCDQHPATDEEKKYLQSFGPVADAFAGQGPIRVFHVDSSWGCASSDGVPSPLRGGVGQVTWWYCESTKQWAQGEGADFRLTPAGPYNHPLVGFYRRYDSDSLASPALRGRS